MKQKLIIKIIPILFLSLFACDSTSEDPDGKWSDNIKLSEKEISFTSEPNTVMITTEGAGWWIDAIGLNDDWTYDLTDIDTTQESFMIEETEFTVERKNAKEIHISMTENSSADERVLKIALQAGNYFDSIKVTQSGN
ncbi:BACON domain-containing protein [Reichenbachiella versicolor]|uniref:BACON domain-containing protein n=1 Tax=Reichenbachiella versicolor TaxID=1821036 RepID=UPI000D6EA088|nr:BACON domain-containing carbohydrate-binding protein [Reichenbachiella versicolor]